MHLPTPAIDPTVAARVVKRLTDAWGWMPDEREAVTLANNVARCAHLLTAGTRTQAHDLLDALIDGPTTAVPTVKPGREAVRLAHHQALMPSMMALTNALGSQADYDRLLSDLTEAVLAILPGKTEAEIRADQEDMDLALHYAYRPEVVAELAVALSGEFDWEAIAEWCGGTIHSGPDGTDSGEWTSWITIPGVKEVATDRTWIVQRHDLTFDVRAEVAGPSERSFAQVGAQAWDEGVRAAASYLRHEALHSRNQTGKGTIMSTDTQPCRDAVDASPSRLTASQYLAHLRWASLSSASQDVDDMTTDLDDNDKPVNPYRAGEETGKSASE